MSRRTLGAMMATVVAALFTAAPEAAQASTCNFVGLSTGANWNLPGSWSCDAMPAADADGIPDADDTAVISGPDNALITDVNAAVLNLTIDTGGTLQFANSRTLTVGGATNLATATVSGAGTLIANGAWSKQGNGTLNVTSVTMDLNAPSTWADGTICLNSDSLFTLDQRLTPGTDSDNIQDCVGGTPGRIEVASTGRIERTDAGSNLFGVPVHNQGAIAIGTGQTLTFTNLQNETGGTLSGTGTAAGTITNAGGIVSPAAGTFTLGSLTQSAGQTNVDSAETLAVTNAHNQSGGTTTIADGGSMNGASHALSGGCVSKRRFPIRLREPRGIKIRRARITFNGKAVRVTKRAGRFRARIDLRGLAKGRFTIVIRITTTAGDKITGKREYRTCAKRRAGSRGRI